MQLIRNMFQKFVDDIDAGNSNLTYEQQCGVLRIINSINIGEEENEMNKTQAAEYLGVCRATFDNYVRDGFIPKGVHVEGFKELRWYKCDLDLYLTNKNNPTQH